jgi:predicted dehydrogenase
MPLNRRGFLQLSAATGVAISTRSLLAAESSSASPVLPRRIGPNDKLNVLSIGVIGTVGGADRKEVASHPMVRIAGLCDVDANSLARAGHDHPDAFRVKDYREAFARHDSKFDAVIVSTPDHTHCAIDTMALAAGKHVYGQKPLELHWDRGNLAFTNHAEATRTIVKRDYRKGFEPVRV